MSTIVHQQKGKCHGLCNRAACLTPLTKQNQFFNTATQAYYCIACARRINHEEKLCILSPRQFITEEMFRDAAIEAGYNANDIQHYIITHNNETGYPFPQGFISLKSLLDDFVMERELVQLYRKNHYV